MEKSYIVIYNTSVNRLEEDLKNNNITRYIILNNTIAAIYVDDSFDEKILNRIDSITWVERSPGWRRSYYCNNRLWNKLLTSRFYKVR